MTATSNVIENPITGERFVILKSVQDTKGELLQMDFFMRPHGFIAGEHIHPHQEEHFRVLSGMLRFRIGGREQIVNAGQEAVVPPGTPHVWWNDGDYESHLIIEFRPALKTQHFFETLFGLARDGKADKRGRPNPLQIAVIALEYKDEVQPSLPMDRLLFGALLPILAPIGRLLGYKARYPQYSNIE